MKRLLYWLIVVPLLAAALLPAIPAEAATVTLRPNLAGDYQEWETVDPPASQHFEVTSDQLDTTFIKTTGSSNKRDVQHLADPTFDSGSQINSVTYYFRATATGSSSGEKIDVIARLDASDQVVTNKETVTRDTWNDYTSAAQTTAPDGASWTYQKVTDLQAGIAVDTLATGETISVSGIWIVVDYTLPPDITNLPNSFDFGTLSEGGTYETTGGLTTAYFTITNNSAFAVNITIGGTDMTGGVTWTLSNDGSAGNMIYGLNAGLEGGSYNVVVKRDSPYNQLVGSLAGGGGTQKWGLQLLAPTTFTDGGAKSGTVTLTATQA